MNEAIKLAIEKGGYEMPSRNNGNRYGQDWEDDISTALLDPLFWQALGRAKNMTGEFLCNCYSMECKAVISGDVYLEQGYMKARRIGDEENFWQEQLK